jgi:four helix bundle protein
VGGCSLLHFAAVLGRLKDAPLRFAPPTGVGGAGASLTRPALGGASGALFARNAREQGDNPMLRIYDDMLACVAMMRGLASAIERYDPDLGRQMRRAASSVVLNTAEGSGSFGRMRTARYRTALGSARETLACLRVAEAWGYVDTMPEALLPTMNRVIGTLVRVAA